MSEHFEPGGIPARQKALVEQQRLPLAYLQDAQRWFAPLADSLALHRRGANSRPRGAPLLVAVTGSQGSGKTTRCAP